MLFFISQQIGLRDYLCIVLGFFLSLVLKDSRLMEMLMFYDDFWIYTICTGGVVFTVLGFIASSNEA